MSKTIIKGNINFIFLVSFSEGSRRNEIITQRYPVLSITLNGRWESFGEDAVEI